MKMITALILLGIACAVIIALLAGCATRPCTMREWATSYDCR